MSIENLEEILGMHKKWLIGEDGGRRANLCGAQPVRCRPVELHWQP